MLSGLIIMDAIPQQKCNFFNILLGLVSKHESEDRNSRSRLEAWDRREEILDLVSKHETEGKKFSISSRSMRLKGSNSRSRLESWNRHLVMLCIVLPKPTAMAASKLSTHSTNSSKSPKHFHRTKYHTGVGLKIINYQNPKMSMTKNGSLKMWINVVSVFSVTELW